jgi:glycosyltransferase involved in cell wall biosynthesis
MQLENDMIKPPLVSICIPAYNSERYINETISSVKNQTYKNWELIIVDDGSTDGTKKAVKSWLHDDRIQLICQQKSGASAARNTAYQRSKGGLIKFLDSDDLMNREMLAAQVALSNDSSQIISAKWGRFHNDDPGTFKLNPEQCWKSSTPLEWLYDSWKFSRSMTTPGIFLIPAALIEKAGLWNEELSLLDDMEYFTRTILAAKQIVFCEQAVLLYRSGNPRSLSAQISNEYAESAYLAVKLSVSHLISTDDTALSQRLAANALQQLLYSFYPDFPQLCRQLEKDISSLGGSDTLFAESGKTWFLSKVIGWQLTKRIKKWLW